MEIERGREGERERGMGGRGGASGTHIMGFLYVVSLYSGECVVLETLRCTIELVSMG